MKRAAWLGALSLLAVVGFMGRASAQAKCTPDLCPVENAAPATAVGRLFELSRVPRDPVSFDMTAFLRITPISGQILPCQISFTVGASPEEAKTSRPLGACPVEPKTVEVSHFKCGHRPRCFFVEPNRGFLSIEVDGVTVVSLPALPPPPPPPTLEAVSIGCAPCRPGDVLNIYTVVRNPTSRGLVAEYTPYIFTTRFEEDLIDREHWENGVIALEPGQAGVLPLTGELTILAETPPGYYFFGARLVHFISGRVLAETSNIRIEILD